MVGIVISPEAFAKGFARGQGHLKDAPPELKSGDTFAFLVWPLESLAPEAQMRCGVGEVNNSVATWERLGADLTKEQLESVKGNLIRRDQPIKYD